MLLSVPSQGTWTWDPDDLSLGLCSAIDWHCDPGHVSSGSQGSLICKMELMIAISLIEMLWRLNKLTDEQFLEEYQAPREYYPYISVDMIFMTWFCECWSVLLKFWLFHLRPDTQEANLQCRIHLAGLQGSRSGLIIETRQKWIVRLWSWKTGWARTRVRGRQRLHFFPGSHTCSSRRTSIFFPILSSAEVWASKCKENTLNALP